MDWIYGWGEYTQFLSQIYKIIKRRLQHIILFPLFFVAKRGETKNIWVFGVLITLGPEPPSPLNWANVYNCMFPDLFSYNFFLFGIESSMFEMDFIFGPILKYIHFVKVYWPPTPLHPKYTWNTKNPVFFGYLH